MLLILQKLEEIKDIKEKDNIQADIERLTKLRGQHFRKFDYGIVEKYLEMYSSVYLKDHYESDLYFINIEYAIGNCKY